MPLAETVTYLEMNSREELRPSSAMVKVCRRYERNAGFSRSLYADVGGAYNWVERSNWTDDQWLERLASPDVETWLACHAGDMAGFFELEMQDGGNVEIVYFGLLPQSVGHGLGGAMLTAAVQRAWDMGASRVWLHTSSLDHPHALPNYRARGFRVYKREYIPGS